MTDLISRQVKLSENVILKDSFETVENIGGVNQSFSGNSVISGFVNCSYPGMEVLERKRSKFRTDFPYTPGLLAFREGPAIVLAYRKLEIKPDIVLVRGSGICHPRFLGMASHIGLLLDQPTIGVTERLLCGKIDGEKIIFKGRRVGWKLKNIYVSPGHKVSLETSLKIVRECMREHRLPEPLYLARKFSRELKGQ